MKFKFQMLLLAAAATTLFASCGGGDKNQSSTTGWKYNDPKWGGFEDQVNFEGQETGPGLVLIEGGTFTMGSVEQDVTMDYNNIPHRVTVSSFYMDETEVSNKQYREYLAWLTRTYAEYPQVALNALPDTLVWRNKLSYNEPFVEYYFRYPAYRDYPVVGINWLQASEFCKWRGNRVNEFLMIAKGILDHSPSTSQDNFQSEAYLYGQYTGNVKQNLRDYTNEDPKATRAVKMEDGQLLPDYRLPTEAEWEYAALSSIGNNPAKGEENDLHRKIYSWNGYSMRSSGDGGEQWHGAMLANFKRGAGDLMGVAGGLNDNADYTAPVKSYMPNDFGLYNMAGNVNEWTMDVYRPLSPMDVSDENSFRGNVYTTKKRKDTGELEDKDSLGRIVYRAVSDSELLTRRNFNKADNINFNDGDKNSEATYQYSVSSLINDHTRVYKGGSWNDRAYYLAPGTRRFLEEDQSTSTIGFRCVMARLGSPEGNGYQAGKSFRSNKRK
ncbi:MAG: hypothetical protein RIQ33_368 [Bacteroidota bacterium]|jgi:gliding motility-associated lipoprotein GldJ